MRGAVLIRIPTFCFLLLSGPLVYSGQDAAADRVAVPVDRAQRVSLSGHRPAWADARSDAGVLPAEVPIEHATIVLARSPERQRALEQFLARQQDPGSPDYHRWLNPVEVGERFGVSASDIAAVTNWLASQNLQVKSVSNSRMLIAFGGSAGAVGEAFGARIDRYVVNGEPLISVASEPSIPAALAPVVRAVSGLYTVKPRPMHRGGVVRLHQPLPAGDLSCGAGGCSHYIFPSDFATIYDLNSLYSSGITGAGQTIAIIGRSRVYNQDIESFQRLTGLTIQDPTVIIPPNGVDPGPPQTAQNTNGTYSEDQFEATIDVTRAGSVAPGAAIDLVVSSSSGGGLDVAAEYVVEHQSGPGANHEHQLWIVRELGGQIGRGPLGHSV